jgi:hypothetical protein
MPAIAMIRATTGVVLEGISGIVNDASVEFNIYIIEIY